MIAHLQKRLPGYILLKKKRMKGGKAMNITYTMAGEHLMPDLVLLEGQTEPQGIWAIRRRNFLKEECRPVYYSMMTSGRLAAHLAKTQQEAEEMMELLCQQMAERERVTEELKEADPMRWTALMNSIRASAEEIVKKELIQI
ncbi:MAG: TnpV protein [Clostridia bacterium]